MATTKPTMPRTTAPTTPPEEGAADSYTCPRCQENAVDSKGAICAPCRKEEAGETEGEKLTDSQVEKLFEPAGDPAPQAASAPVTPAAPAPTPAPPKAVAAPQQQGLPMAPTPAKKAAPTASAAFGKGPAPAPAAAAARAAGPNAMPAAPAQAQNKPKIRMSIEAVKSNAADEEPRIWLYGTEGIGKSTFAADAPDAVFIPGGKSPNIQRPMFPVPESFPDVIDAVNELTVSDHKFHTLVFDDFDYVEGLVWDHAIRKYNETNPKQKAHSIEDVGGGFGKGYQAAVDIFRQLLPRLERLRAAKNMQVIFVSHAMVKPYKNPKGDGYDRFVNSMHEKAVALFRRWCDAMLFADYLDTIRYDWRAKRAFAEGDGQRALFTQRRPTHDAKNRYDLPYQMPLDYGEVAAAIKLSRDPAVLLVRVEEKIEQINDEAITTWVRGQLQTNPSADRLSRINARLAERIDEMQAREIDGETAASEAAQ